MSRSTPCDRQAGFAWPTGVNGAVSLTFDDARFSQIDRGIPILDRLGVHATFYVTLARVRQRLDAWRLALAAGHEIGGHTFTHPCSTNFGFAGRRGNALEEMTLDDMNAELIESNAQIEALLGVRPVSFSYPCGQKFVGRGERVRSYVPLVARHYLTGRGWRDEYVNAPDRCDLCQVGGIPLDGMDFEQVRPQIARAAQTGNWLVLAGHDVGTEPGSQTTRVATLEAICAYGRDPANGIWIDTVQAIGEFIARTRGDVSGRRTGEPPSAGADGSRPTKAGRALRRPRGRTA